MAKARGSGRRSRSHKASSARRVSRRSKRGGRGRRPKRALSPYIFFCKHRHSHVTADNPNLPFTEVGRILGAQWQQMSAKEKQPYIKKAKADKKRHAREIKRYGKG